MALILKTRSKKRVLAPRNAVLSNTVCGALRNKLESIFEHVYLSRNERDGSIIVSDKERRETKAINRIQDRISFSTNE